MKKKLTKVIAVLLSVLMMTAVVAGSASAATRSNVKHYKTYVCLGDSVASGFGLPQYNAICAKSGKKIVYKTRISGSYADQIAKAT